MKQKVSNINPLKWVERYADQMYSFAFRRLNNEELAQDLVQDTFTTALHKQSQFRGEASEKTWLFQILKNKITDHFRSAKHQKETSETEWQSSHFNTKGTYEYHWNANATPQPWTAETDAEINSQQFQDIFSCCLSKLAKNSAAVFQLKHIEELSSKEICKELNISTSNYWVLMHRAKLQLRRCLEKKWFTKS